MKHLLAALMGLMLLSCGVGHAQITVAHGKGAPKKVKGVHWYHDTAGHTAWTDLDLEWTDLGIEGVTEMYGAGNILVIRSKLGYSLLGPFGEYLWAAPHIRITDELLMAWDSMTTHIYLLSGSQLHPENGLPSRCWPIGTASDTVQGIPAFCFPDYLAANDTVDCDTLRAFGMFGTNGKWLIAPQYDAPFHFENGAAEVLQQGQRRKINEQGDFVE